jgi:TRAP-type C4-dicarboxylate transport system permease small subunit
MKRTLAETFNRLVVFACGLLMVTFGYANFLHGFGSFRMPSLTPLAWWYLSVPVSGFFICLFTIEQLVNGWRNGFEGQPRSEIEKEFTI